MFKSNEIKVSISQTAIIAVTKTLFFTPVSLPPVALFLLASFYNEYVADLVLELSQDMLDPLMCSNLKI